MNSHITDTTAESGAGHVRPRVAVSSCLLGEPVRFNAGHSRDRFLADQLSRFVDWVPICPEMELGLGTPRETLRLERRPGGPHLITGKTGRDLTEAMTSLAAARAATLDVDGYVFKSRSPSCGTHGIPAYVGSAAADRRNRGVFAARIIDAHPLLPVEDEGRLNDEVIREAFIERIFAHARLRAFLSAGMSPRALVAFHARHKLQILAHDPASYRRLGRLVAQAGTLAGDRLAADYAEAFRAALAVRATVGRNVNVLQHCLGMVSDDLDRVRRADLVEAIHDYQRHLVPLSVPLALLRHHAHGAGATYLYGQTYLSPYPHELALRHHIPA
ncbi:YbgA family protein [Sphaerimonospora sp. CA-214678]|uniref:YbgA family protein n=1 Tax=Sphaerimonospora sp. CA-214678 TaxID=3240029 RepID=UPI003D8F05D3